MTKAILEKIVYDFIRTQVKEDIMKIVSKIDYDNGGRDGEWEYDGTYTGGAEAYQRLTEGIIEYIGELDSKTYRALSKKRKI